MASHPIVAEDVARIVAAELPWQEFSGANVLISGAAGFLPAYLVETLVHLNRTVLEKPARIVALVRNAARARERLGPLMDSGEVELLVRDVREPFGESLVAAAPSVEDEDPWQSEAGRREMGEMPVVVREPERWDFIVHAASQASPRYYASDPVGTLEANVLGTRNLLELARRSGTRGFLYFSSGDVYGISRELERVTAERDYGWLDPMDVRSCYGESKRMGETMCVAWAKQYGVPVKVVRPFHTYGPGMRLDDGRVFADFVRDILNGGPIQMFSDGRARRCFCYLGDAAEAFFRVLLTGGVGEAYNVANAAGEASIAELAALLGGEFGLEVVRRDQPDANYVPSPIPFTRPSTAKLEALGWKATTGILDGFRRTVASYRGGIGEIRR